MTTTAVHYAQGKKAWGTCARGGHRMLLRDMVRDPLTGLLVDPDWAERPLMRPATDIIDGVVLRRPAPQLDQISTTIYIGNIFDWATGGPLPPLNARYGSLPTWVSVFDYLMTDDGQQILTDDGQPIICNDILGGK